VCVCHQTLAIKLLEQAEYKIVGLLNKQHFVCRHTRMLGILLQT